MFSDPHFQAQLARQHQADIRAAAQEARTVRLFRLMRREARRERRAAIVPAAPASPIPVPGGRETVEIRRRAA